MQEQRALWRQGSIHIFEDNPNDQLPLVSSLEILKDLGVNILQTRCIYGKSPHESIDQTPASYYIHYYIENQCAKCPEEPMTGVCHDSLSSLFSLSPKDMLDCNVLDIPLSSTQGYLPPRCLR